MTLALGCNYSSSLMELLSSESILLDWIKLSRWDVWQEEYQAIENNRPILLHVLPSAGDDPPSRPPANELVEAINRCGSPHIALHLSARMRLWSPEVTVVEVLDRIVQTTLAWKQALPIPLLLENVTYYKTRGFLRYVSEPTFITEVCSQTGCGLLLDLAHARVAAEHHGNDVFRYLEAFPLELVREVHVNGPGIDPNLGLRDLHEEMQEVDYGLLCWLLAHSNPQIVTLEYGGTGPGYESRSSIDVLRRQLYRLATLISKLG